MITSSRRPRWPRAHRGNSAPPEWLPKLARGIAQRSREAFRGHFDITYGEPQPGVYACGPAGDRAWLALLDAGVAWCTVDLRSQAALLAMIIGGQGAERETQIERSIVGEAIERLLSTDDFRQTRWTETAIDRPAGDHCWRCNIEVTTQSGRCAILQLFAPAADRDPAGETSVPNISTRDIGRVHVTVRAELRKFQSPLAQILAWAPGTVVPLRSQALAQVELLVQDSIIANGRLGSLETNSDARLRAVEIEHIAGAPAA
jgi:flagellar motor switch/type III secretory pathway protein FliN